MRRGRETRRLRRLLVRLEALQVEGQMEIGQNRVARHAHPRHLAGFRRRRRRDQQREVERDLHRFSDAWW